MEKIIDIIFSGLSMGAIYALVALGFVLIFKSTGILNFAQGELCMVGAFICYYFATLLNVPYLISILMAIALGAMLGALIDVLIFRRLVGEPIYATIMVTIGLASILVALTGLIWGHDTYSIRSPFIGKTIVAGKMVFAQASLATIVVSIVLFILFIVFFNRSLLGVALKGTAEDSDTAGLMGINVKKMHMLAWTIGALVAGVAGIFLAEQSFVHTGMSHTGIKAMSAAILGGMESLGGAIIGGIIVGVVESFAASYLSGLEMGGFHFGDIKDVAAFAIMILVLMIRPHGIFGKKEVERV
ncbi:MAG: branched-chain amino acid ABC transporter permease [Desulfobacterales bacterium]|nr:MAG: branched-chain amino acid ABC transporter permease [Desulfobacterales bacterium]